MSTGEPTKFGPATQSAGEAGSERLTDVKILGGSRKEMAPISGDPRQYPNHHSFVIDVLGIAPVLGLTLQVAE